MYFNFKKHFDPEHPENHNLRKMNKKDSFLEIYENNKWNTKTYKDALDQIITIKLEETFATYMEKMIEENQIIKREIFQHFMKEVGSILEWDLSVDNYNFSYNNNNMRNEMTERNRKMMKTRIYKLFCECIYKYSRMIHKK